MSLAYLLINIAGSAYRAVWFLLQHNIFRLEVSMSDALRVKVFNSLFNITQQTPHILFSKATTILRLIQDLINQPILKCISDKLTETSQQTCPVP